MIATGITHRGMVRDNNQDAFLTRILEQQQAVLLIVCDGMGGANAGNIASITAANAFVNETIRLLNMEMGARAAMQLALDKANQAVYRHSAEDPALEGMGTTLVAAYVTQRQAIVLNVGDSRAYVINDHTAIQVTNDHSYVHELFLQGKLTAEQTRCHPNRNLITRAVGVESTVQADVFEIPLAMNEVLLLCTDGLTGMLSDDEIFGLVDFSPNLDAATKLLVASACQRGGSDNVTALLFRQQDDPKTDDVLGGVL